MYKPHLPKSIRNKNKKGTTLTSDIPSPKNLKHSCKGLLNYWEPTEFKPNIGCFYSQFFKPLCQRKLPMQLLLSKERCISTGRWLYIYHTQHTVNSVATRNKCSPLPQKLTPYQTVHSDCFPSRLSLTSERNEARRGNSSIKPSPQRLQLTLQIWISAFHTDLD